MKEIQAARLLSSWQQSTKATVAVTKATYDLLLTPLPPKFVSIDSKSKEVITVVLLKIDAVNHLKSKYNLFEAKDYDINPICRDTTGEQRV